MLGRSRTGPLGGEVLAVEVGAINMTRSAKLQTTESAVPVPTRRQALEQAKRSPGFRGICRFCGCTDNNACVDDFDQPCSWFDDRETVCTTLTCVAAYKDSQTGLTHHLPKFLHDLQESLADRYAKSLIECNSNLADGAPKGWINISYSTCSLARELIYLEARGLLERHPTRSELVRFHG